MQFRSLSQTQRMDTIAQNIHSREVEWFSYDLNVTNYANLLASEEYSSLPDEWPNSLVKYRNLTRDEAAQVIADQDTLNQVQRLQQRDRLKMLIRTEQIERDRVATYRDQLLASVNPSEQAALDAAFQRLATKMSSIQ